jgi:SEC-C motif
MKIGRNDPCHCGSGRKYKNCHFKTDAVESTPHAAELGRKGADEIRRILVEEFGFTNLDAYQKWVTEVRPGMSPTRALIDKLSPDIRSSTPRLPRRLATFLTRSTRAWTPIA